MTVRTNAVRLAGGLAVTAALLVAAPAQAFAATTPAPAPPPAVSPAPTPAPTAPPYAVPAPPRATATEAPTATPAPAPPRGGQVERVPVGGAETGGGSATQDDEWSGGTLVALGGLGLVGAAGALWGRRGLGRRGLGRGMLGG